ncbi:MAG TPA: sigma-70 family RNA polymerase sigma factor [Anaerolineae bacterium]
MAVDHYTASLTLTQNAAILLKERKDRQAGRLASTESSLADSRDAVLIQACLDGDQAAWNTLVERYARLVYSIPLRWGLSPADADDVFQNVFTIVFNRLKGLRNRTCLSAWLMTITARECWRVGKASRAYVALDESVEDTGTPPSEWVQRWELQRAVHAAISRLDPRSQELLKALFFDTGAPTYDEIAARLGLAVGSIGSARARCLKKLEAILIDMGIDFSV